MQEEVKNRYKSFKQNLPTMDTNPDNSETVKATKSFFNQFREPRDPAGKMSQNDLLLIVIAILLPPVAVFLKKGANVDLLINIILCLLMWLPGIIHAIWIVLQNS